MGARALLVRRRGSWQGAVVDTITLDYEGRFVRRRRLRADGGTEVVLDLEATTSLDSGDVLELEDGRLVGIEAAAEALFEVRGDLPRLAWHVGNRHTPCEMCRDHLRIRRDHVIAEMLQRLGGQLSEIEAPFRPEGGAYGHGRTHGHAH